MADLATKGETGHDISLLRLGGSTRGGEPPAGRALGREADAIKLNWSS